MRPMTTLAVICVIVFVWGSIITFLYINRPPQPIEDQNSLKNYVDKRLQLYQQHVETLTDTVDKMDYKYSGNIARIQEDIQKLKLLYNRTVNLKLISSQAPSKKDVPSSPTSFYSSNPIAVLLIACNRETVNRAINSLLKYRPSQEKFPIIVSQDCNHEKTADVITSYKNSIKHIKQPDLSDIPLERKETKMKGYYKIARHYKWALTQVFEVYGYRVAIVVEDDLEVAPDFFSYMEATRTLLLSDSTLMCVSAWNDNGKKGFIDTKRNDLLYRSDFFPGLGWMLTSDLWQELKPKWPKSYWDDWLRQDQQRKGRSCIRPEVSRTMTFGRKGVSNGQYFNQHLQYIVLEDNPYNFTSADLSYLLQRNYQRVFVDHVHALPSETLTQIQQSQSKDEVVIRYSSNKDFTNLAKKFGLMSDLKDGVPRTAYKGIVSFMRNGRRIHLAPPITWTGYQS